MGSGKFISLVFSLSYGHSLPTTSKEKCQGFIASPSFPSLLIPFAGGDKPHKHVGEGRRNYMRITYKAF